jgi:chaperonin GroEL
MKEIYYNQDARAKVLAGAKKLYDAVKVTYGPKGQNVIIEKEYGAPVITHDGVTVAEAVDLGSTPENMGEKVGANLIKAASQ